MQSQKQTPKNSALFGEWRDYPHSPETTQVSDKGWVRNKRTGRITQGHRKGKEYLWYYYQTTNGKRTLHPVHCMVLETFVGDCPPGMQCHHVNSNPRDNRLENLRWVTPSENNNDEHHKCALGKPVILMDLMGNVICEFPSRVECARYVGCTNQVISKLCLGRTRQKRIHGKYTVKYKDTIIKHYYAC